MRGRRHDVPSSQRCLLPRVACLPIAGCLAMLVAAICLGSGWSRVNAIPPYMLPGPGWCWQTLVADGPPVALAARHAHAPPFEGFAARRRRRRRAGGAFNQSRLIEHSFYPYAVILQVTPVVAIAPLLLIYLPQPAGGAGLRLDRRVLPGAGQHHARAEFGRPQSRRPVSALRRVALAGAAGI